MIKKILLLLLLILFNGINIYSITYDELLDSYNFSYQEANIKIKSINYSLNQNTSNLNLSLIIHGLYGEHELLFNLYSKNTSTSSFNSSKLFLKDNMKVNFNLKTSNLINSKYSFQLAIKEKEKTLYKNYNLFEIQINNSNNLNLTSIIKNNKINNFNNTNFTQITKEKLPDIKIKSFLYNKTNNTIKIEIENNGEKDIGPFYYSIYNENLTLIEEKYHSFLRHKQTRITNINLKNFSTNFIIYLDLYNFYKETNKENNLYFWPEEEKLNEDKNIKAFINLNSGGGGRKINSVIKNEIKENPNIKKNYNMNTNLSKLNKTKKAINNSIKNKLFKNQTKNKNKELNSNYKFTKLKNSINITEQIKDNLPLIASSVVISTIIIATYFVIAS